MRFQCCLDQSTLPRQMEGTEFGSKIKLLFFICLFCSKRLPDESEGGPESRCLPGRLCVPQVECQGQVGDWTASPASKRWCSAKGVNFRCVFVCVEVLSVQGDDVTASHKVQSVRATVEQTIGDLKKWKVMCSNKLKTAEAFESIFDCVAALHNFRVLCKADKNFDIPARRAVVTDEHIFKPIIQEKEVDLKIPKDQPNLEVAKYHHIRDFTRFLSSAAPAIKKALERGGQEVDFTPTVLERGKNLHNGAYVLQLQVHPEPLDVWTLKYIVGASYS